MSLTLSIDSPVRSQSEAVEGGMLRLTGKAPSHIVFRLHEPRRWGALRCRGRQGHALRGCGPPGYRGRNSAAIGPAPAHGRSQRTDSVRCREHRLPRIRSRARPTPPAKSTAACRQQLDAAMSKPYAALRDAHMDDHRSYSAACRSICPSWAAGHRPHRTPGGICRQTRSRSGGAVFPIRPLSADRKLAAGFAAGQSQASGMSWCARPGIPIGRPISISR